MNYKITITNNENHICNPLLKLEGVRYATCGAAKDAIFAALYDDITGDKGCEMIHKSEYADLDKYIDACKDFIWNNGYATEDGVSATVEKCD